MTGNDRIAARVQEIVGRPAERAEVSVERVLRELAAIGFSDITKAVTWGPNVEVREDEDGGRVMVITSAVSLVPSEKAHVNWFTRWRWHKCYRHRSAIGTDMREHVHPAEEGQH
jgi:hypothetical protein